MPNCANCQTPLSKPADEYGPRDAPLCLDCYLSGESINDPEIEIAAIRAMLKQVGEGISREAEVIWQLRDMLALKYNEDTVDEIEHAERCRDALEVRRGELRGRMFELIKLVKAARESDLARLIRWTEGVKI